MKQKYILFIITILFLAVVAFVAANFLFPKSAPPPESSETIPTTPLQLEPEFLEGAFLENQDVRGTFVQSEEPVELSLQGAKEGKSVAVSWDGSKVSIFHIVLLNTKLQRQTIWLLSSLDSGVLPEGEEGIKRKDISLFVPSGYVVGDTMEGFQSLDEQQEFELTLGQQYYLQMLGFTKDGQSIAINKKFIFTASCLPPDCK